MRWMDSSRGVTLVELVIVLAIVITLVSALGISFAGWIGRYAVEKQVKDIHADMLSARLMALQRNRAHFLQFQDASSYRIIEDSNDNGENDAGVGDDVLASFPKATEMPVTVNGTGVPATFRFSKRGTISPLRTLRISHATDPDYDCIVVSMMRINAGRMSGGTCMQK